MALESNFQRELIKELKRRFSGCYILKNDSSYLQGVPDLIILWNDKWATLEVKRDAKAIHQPNQKYHILRMNKMSFAAFIYPENKEEVLDALQRSFKAQR